MPPNQPWSSEVVLALSNASCALGRMAGAIAPEPEGHPVLPFILREAAWSLRIDHPLPPLREVLMRRFDAAAEGEDGPYVTIHQYARMLQDPVREGAVDLDQITQWHGALFGHGTAVPDAGTLRNQLHWLGPPGTGPDKAWFIPPPPEALPDALAAYLSFMQHQNLPPLIRLALGHYQLEAIHPFRYGNGPWSRLVLSRLAAPFAGVPLPAWGISNYIHAHRKTYFEKLDGVRKNAAWDAWLIFFLEAAARSADDLRQRRMQYRDALAEAAVLAARQSSRVPGMLVQLLVHTPFVTANYASQKLEVAFTTAQRAIDKLQEVSVLTQTGGAHRYRIYGAPALLAALED